MECFICGVNDEENALYDAVVHEGIVKICEGCSVKEGIPIVRRPSALRLKESEKNRTVYERLSSMANLAPGDSGKTGSSESKGKNAYSKEIKIAGKRIGSGTLAYPSLKQIQPQYKDDLVRNYHWVIFQARRARRLTQKQIGEAVGEPESSIKLIERGILPNDYQFFVKKIQTCLGITLFAKPQKDVAPNFLESVKPQGDELTIGDVKSEEKKSFFPYWRNKLGILQGKREKRKEEEASKEKSDKAENKEPGDEESSDENNSEE